MIRIKSRVTACAFVLGAMPACSSSGPPEPAGRAPTSTAPGPVLAGYVHSLGNSRFRIGQDVSLETSGPTLRRWRGTAGAFASDPTNGWSMGVIDAEASGEAYLLDEAVQSAMVKAYFVHAGIPETQIARVDASYVGTSEGVVGEAATPKLESINSILRRSANGIPVVESVAWAKMTVSGQVEAETVFWPSIDMTVVSGAAALAAKMSDGAFRAAFIAKLPGHVYKDHGVVIHHSTASIHATPVAYVSYDVTLDASGTAAPRHFDANGLEFQLPHETATAVGTPRRGSPDLGTSAGVAAGPI